MNALTLNYLIISKYSTLQYPQNINFPKFNIFNTKLILCPSEISRYFWRGFKLPAPFSFTTWHCKQILHARFVPPEIFAPVTSVDQFEVFESTGIKFNFDKRWATLSSKLPVGLSLTIWKQPQTHTTPLSDGVTARPSHVSDGNEKSNIQYLGSQCLRWRNKFQDANKK